MIHIAPETNALDLLQYTVVCITVLAALVMIIFARQHDDEDTDQ